MSVPRYCSEIEPENMPDMVAVIRCKDCKYYHKPEYGYTIGDCTYRSAWYSVREDEYCSSACKKDGDGG